MTNRRLRKTETGCGARHVALFVQELEDPQQVEVDVHHESA
jgi:hypothetical protein